MAVMERERKGGADERLDNLNHRVDEGFTETKNEFRALRSEMREEFRGMRGEMAANHRVLVQMAAAIWITAVVGFLGVVATVITHT